MGRVKQAMMDGEFEEVPSPFVRYIVRRDLVVGDLGTLLTPGTQIDFDGTRVRLGTTHASCRALRLAIDAGYLEAVPVSAPAPSSHPR